MNFSRSISAAVLLTGFDLLGRAPARTQTRVSVETAKQTAGDWCSECPRIAPDRGSGMRRGEVLPPPVETPSFMQIAMKLYFDQAYLQGFVTKLHRPMPTLSSLHRGAAGCHRLRLVATVGTRASRDRVVEHRRLTARPDCARPTPRRHRIWGRERCELGQRDRRQKALRYAAALRPVARVSAMCVPKMRLRSPLKVLSSFHNARCPRRQTILCCNSPTELLEVSRGAVFLFAGAQAR